MHWIKIDRYIQIIPIIPWSIFNHWYASIVIMLPAKMFVRFPQQTIAVKD